MLTKCTIIIIIIILKTLIYFNRIRMGKQQANNNNNMFSNNKNNNNNKVQTQKETSHSQKEGISKHIEQVVKTREGNEASSVKEDGKEKKQNSKTRDENHTYQIAL